MGDRAVVIFHDGDDEFSPAVYLHWNAEAVPKWLREHAELMQGRRGDVPYAAARFIGLCHTKINGNLSLGVSNLSPREMGALEDSDTREDQLRRLADGDGGAVLVNVNDCTWIARGGYLELEETG